MSCFQARTVWRSPRHLHGVTGKPRVYFKKPSLFYSSPLNLEFYSPEEFQIPGCKSPKCIGCVEERSRSWAVRCWHESQLYDDNCFITLTFNDKFLPANGLDHSYFQKFMKRFRKTVGKVRYFMAGEYGSQFFRPHFHACIFGFDFPDRLLYTVRNGVRLYTSEMLSRLWSDPFSGESYGFTSIGDVTFESAAYVARYCVKKQFGSDAEAHYQGRKPEYTKCSLKPGIAKGWFTKFKDSVVYDDAVTLRDGVSKTKPPKYYDRLYELDNPVHSAKIKQMRNRKAFISPDNTPERLRVREAVKLAQMSQLQRSL